MVIGWLHGGQPHSQVCSRNEVDSAPALQLIISRITTIFGRMTTHFKKALTQWFLSAFSFILVFTTWCWTERPRKRKRELTLRTSYSLTVFISYWMLQRSLLTRDVFKSLVFFKDLSSEESINMKNAIHKLKMWRWLVQFRLLHCLR